MQEYYYCSLKEIMILNYYFKRMAVKYPLPERFLMTVMTLDP